MGLHIVVYAAQVNTQQVKSSLTLTDYAILVFVARLYGTDYAILVCVARLYGAVLIMLLCWSCNTVSLHQQFLSMLRYIFGETDIVISMKNQKR